MSNDLWTGKAARQPMKVRLSVPSDFDDEDRAEVYGALKAHLSGLGRTEGFDVHLSFGEDTEVSG